LVCFLFVLCGFGVGLGGLVVWLFGGGGWWERQIVFGYLTRFVKVII